jgi:hypothetical protein
MSWISKVLVFYIYFNKTGTNNLASNVCLELFQVYIYLNLDKTSTNYLASNVCLEFLNSDSYFCITGDQWQNNYTHNQYNFNTSYRQNSG